MSILVTGATGKQGGAAVKHLLLAKSGHTIKALVRNPESPQAKALASQGAELVKGDLDDVASLDAALQGVTAAYLVTPYDITGHDAANETNQGKKFVDAAKKHGVQFLVFASVGDAEVDSGVPHFESKARIEEHLKASGLEYTFLRPTFFMENFDKDASSLGLYAAALEGHKMQMISVDDIGAVAAECILNPKKFSGQAIPLAADDLDIEEVADAYKASGRQRPDTKPSKESLDTLPEDMKQMFHYIAENNFGYDIAHFKKQFPRSMTLADWMKA